MNSEIIENKRIIKNNPAFLSQQDLIDNFVVRHEELNLIMQTIRENTSADHNQHVMVIGSRGIGKTMLLLRATAEVRKDEGLNREWYPLVFSEESYQVCTPGEFWLESLFHLGLQTGDKSWKETYKELREELDEKRLCERALNQLLDFADIQKKKILLIVENFNMLIGEQIEEADAWNLRHTLINEKRIMLLASSTSRFDEIDNSDQAMFELFRVQEIEPLNSKQCRELWNNISEKPLSEKQIRPLEILTGGNPRLLMILASFAFQMSFNELMEDLKQLVDNHTEYFKSHLDALAVKERKVYLALAELWDPATAKDVAIAARLNVNSTSSLLGRLVDKGAVVEVKKHGRKKWYQVSERMYNIYHLMRKRGGPSSRVEAVVRFMVQFYSEDELVKVVKCIAEEACCLERCDEHIKAYSEILNNVTNKDIAEKIKKEISGEFIKKIYEDVLPQLKEAIDLLEKEQSLVKAEQILQKCYSVFFNTNNILFMATTLYALGAVNELLGDYSKAESYFKSSCKLFLQIDIKDLPIESLSTFMFKFIDFNLFEETIGICRKIMKLNANDVVVLGILGFSLNKVGEYNESAEILKKATELDPSEIFHWLILGDSLLMLGKYDDAEKAFNKAASLDLNYYSNIWYKIGNTHLCLERFEEAEKAFCKDAEMNPCSALPWYSIGYVRFDKLKHYSKAKEAFVRGIKSAESIFDDKIIIESNDDAIIEYCSIAAGLGLGEEILKAIEKSESAKILEPLIVGIKIYLGLEVMVAKEIYEVGKDIAKNIKEIEDKVNGKESSNKEELVRS